MTGNDILQIFLFFGVLLLLAKPLGVYMARVYEGQPSGLDRVLGPVERLFYRICGIKPDEEMSWKKYAGAVLLFSAAGLFFLYALQRLQGFLPLNPQKFPAVSPDSSFNTAISFITNTNWQGYGGETTMSYLTPDGRAWGAEFRVCRGRYGCARCPDPGVCQALGRDHRQLLGRPHPFNTLHPDAACSGLFHAARISGSCADLQRIQDRCAYPDHHLR